MITKKSTCIPIHMPLLVALQNILQQFVINGVGVTAVPFIVKRKWLKNNPSGTFSYVGDIIFAHVRLDPDIIELDKVESWIGERGFYIDGGGFRNEFVIRAW